MLLRKIFPPFIEALDMRFTVEVEGEERPMKAGGRDERVTKSNLNEYFKCVAQFHLVNSVELPFYHFQRGYMQAVNSTMHHNIVSSALEIITCGKPLVSWQSVRQVLGV